MSAVDSQPLGGVGRAAKVANDMEGIQPVRAELIAHVLRRAHRNAEVHNNPHEARAILHVAQLFADALGEIDPRFDRVRFIEASTKSIYAPMAQ